MPDSRYRWRDRHDDLIRRPNPWPLRIEAGIAGGLMIASLIAAVVSVLR